MYFVSAWCQSWSCSGAVDGAKFSVPVPVTGSRAVVLVVVGLVGVKEMAGV